MSWIYDDDQGVVIDEETGEVEEYGSRTPSDLASYLAFRIHDAGKQKNEWDRTWKGLRAALLKQMSDRTEVYENGLVARTQARTWPKQDVPGLKAQLEGLELTVDELRELVMAAKSFDAESIKSKDLRALVQSFTSYQTGQTYVTVAAVKRTAPLRKELPE